MPTLPSFVMEVPISMFINKMRPITNIKIDKIPTINGD